MRIEHIAMYVENLNGAKSFFEKYFEAQSSALYQNKDFSSYFLSFDDGSRLEIMNKTNIKMSDNDKERTGFIHIALSVGSKQKVDELTDKLKEDGYKVVSGPRITGDGYYESCVCAFENNLIEITV